MPKKKQINELKVGDTVAIRHSGTIYSPQIGKITRVTATRFEVEGVGLSFRRDTGRAIGAPWRSTYAAPVTAEDRRKVKAAADWAERLKSKADSDARQKRVDQFQFLEAWADAIRKAPWIESKAILKRAIANWDFNLSARPSDPVEGGDDV